jgi:anti-sigma regulatory factor (Ser/Thr protein kinase)
MSISALHEKDFPGRQDELAGLLKRVLQADTGAVQSAVLAGPPGIGKTEMLKQLFSQLFWKQNRVAPFFYTVSPALLTASIFSRTYLTRFICQRLAFQKKEQALLYRDGITTEDLSVIAEELDALWAKDLLDQYGQAAADPVGGLRIALAAPHRSALSTGIPVAVLIDDFHRLTGLHRDGVPEHRLVALFEEPVSLRKTPYVIAGSMAELQEIPAVSGLERIPLQPLGSEATSVRILSLLQEHGSEGSSMPPLLLRHLGGNPFYLDRVVTRACAIHNPVEKDFWNAYVGEIMDGGLSLFWSSILKGHLADLSRRRMALLLLYKIYHSSDAFSCERIAKSFAQTDSQANALMKSLYLAGFLRGEFGLFRATEDRVLQDVIDHLYQREILAKSTHDLEQNFLDRLLPQKEQTVRFDMTLPMAKEAELIAAQCIDQIGKNFKLNQDAIGQLQIAVIEACINAMEHGRGMGKNVYVSITVDADRMEVSVESAGQEFIVQETGEPVGDLTAGNAPKRGWGLKLIKRFADEVKFEKTSLGTKVVLVKKIEKSAGIPREDATNRE